MKLSSRSTTASDGSCSPIHRKPKVCPSQKTKKRAPKDLLGKRGGFPFEWLTNVQAAADPVLDYLRKLVTDPNSQTQTTSQHSFQGTESQELSPDEVHGQSEIIRNMVRQSTFPSDVSNPVVNAIFTRFVDKESQPITCEGKDYYALESRRASQLTNKTHGCVREELKRLSENNLEEFFELTPEQASQVGNIADIKVETRKIMLENKKLSDVVFTPEFFGERFIDLQENTTNMIELLLEKARPCLAKPADQKLRKAFSDSLFGYKSQKAFTVVENYWSVIVYCNEFLYELRNKEMPEEVRLHNRIKEIKDFFEKDLSAKGLLIEEKLHPRPAKYRKSSKGMHFQAYIIRTGRTTDPQD